MRCHRSYRLHFDFFKRKLKLHPPQCARRFSTCPSAQVEPLFVDARNAPKDFTSECAVVYRDFLSEEEGELVTSAILSRLKRRRYQKGHWDAVIVNYKEVELQDETIEDSRILDIFSRVRQHVEEHHLTYQPVSWLSCHAIDYNKDGELNPHVDSVKFSGHSVSGLSLLSPAVMRLTPDDEPDTGGHVDLLLPPLSLYCLTGVGRYRYAHQLLPGECVFTGPTGVETIVSRDHRLSIIFRDAKPEELE